MTFFIEEPSKILAWLNAKGYSGTLNDAFDTYLRSGSALLGGTSYDQIMFRLGGEGTLNDRLTTMFQSKTGLSNRKDAERKFFQDSSLDMFAIIYTSQYPPAYNGTYVKTTTEFLAVTYSGYNATNPSLSLIGTQANNQFLANATTNTSFNVDLGSAKTIKRIYYEAGHNGTDRTWDNCGVQNFTFWGSNTSTAFDDTTYATDTNWTQLTCDRSTWAAHVAANTADPQYSLVTNSTAYRYYRMKCADNWDGAKQMGIRRIELQS